MLVSKNKHLQKFYIIRYEKLREQLEMDGALRKALFTKWSGKKFPGYDGINQPDYRLHFLKIEKKQRRVR